jgi:hypothetical protein
VVARLEVGLGLFVSELLLWAVFNCPEIEALHLAVAAEIAVVGRQILSQAGRNMCRMLLSLPELLRCVCWLSVIMAFPPVHAGPATNS